MLHQLMPNPIKAYPSDQGIPVGTVFQDPATGKKYMWVKRSADTLATKVALTSLGTSRAAFEVKLPTAADQPFAGVRVASAESLDATNPYGLVQIGGTADFISGDTSVVADDYIAIHGTAGKVKVAPTPAAAKYRFAIAEATQGSADSAVVAEIIENCWGV